VNLELRVFDSQGNLLATNTYVFPQNQNNTSIQSSFFALSADQLSASAFDNTGRAQLTGVVSSIDPNNPNKPPNPTCGFVPQEKYSTTSLAGQWLTLPACRYRVVVEQADDDPSA